MKDYFAPDNWYEPTFEKDCECSTCDKKEVVLEKAADFLSAIVKRLYIKDSFDAGRLEQELDELCYLLGVDMIAGDLQIQAKRESPKYLSQWMSFNNQFLLTQ